jgi:hypothetical protein
MIIMTRMFESYDIPLVAVHDGKLWHIVTRSGMKNLSDVLIFHL